MKKLIGIATLGLVLSFSSLSFADNYVFGVKTPVVKSEVRNELKGGNVEKDFIGFYISPKTSDKATSLREDKEPSKKDSYIVFGVEVPRSVKS
jgi:hypothetical protein